MTDRVLDLSEEPAKLVLRLKNLVIARSSGAEVSVPLEDLATVVLAHPQALITGAVLHAMSESGTLLVVCDERRLPSAMLMPLEGHHRQQVRFHLQAEAKEPLKKGLWKQVVQAKILAQAHLLQRLHGVDHGLKILARDVKSGDTSNAEAQASRRYWTALFGERLFRRDREAEDQNRMLNYGYAVLRAMTARAIAGAGLHPTFGLHHYNRGNAFALADDLMEPLRSLIDGTVVRLVEQYGPQAELDRRTKSALIGSLLGRFEFDGEQCTVFDGLSRCAFSLVRCLEKREKKLKLFNPRLEPEPEDAEAQS
jgi:CRISP-associated protein Cas1